MTSSASAVTDAPDEDAEDAAERAAVEAERRRANEVLLAEDGVVDCDELVAGLDPTLRAADNWHLTREGYKVLGERRAGGPADASSSEASLYVSADCQGAIVASVIVGPYEQHGTNHGRPMYRKLGAPGSANVLVFFWDERDGPSWAGWWFGPKLGWEDPGWARHEDGAALRPPAAGWKVPPDGPVSTTVRIFFDRPAAVAVAGGGGGRAEAADAARTGATTPPRAGTVGKRRRTV